VVVDDEHDRTLAVIVCAPAAAPVRSPIAGT
jgi:hypothetical protein